jgi:hypothetical protein
VLTGSEVTAGVVSNHEFARGFGVNFTGISKRDADVIAGLLG